MLCISCVARRRRFALFHLVVALLGEIFEPRNLKNSALMYHFERGTDLILEVYLKTQPDFTGLNDRCFISCDAAAVTHAGDCVLAEDIVHIGIQL